MVTMLNDDLYDEQEVKNEGIIDGELSTLEVSLNSLEDSNSEWSLRFKGKVGKKIVSVLIDRGATQLHFYSYSKKT